MAASPNMRNEEISPAPRSCSHTKVTNSRSEAIVRPYWDRRILPHLIGGGEHAGGVTACMVSHAGTAVKGAYPDSSNATYQTPDSGGRSRADLDNRKKNQRNS